MPLHFPFSAVLGCDLDAPGGLDDMGLALVLTAIFVAIICRGSAVSARPRIASSRSSPMRSRIV